jgi:CRISPR-associated protein Csb2
MTLALRFELLAGRYHATEWDRHVNEGSVEWPPSPWRVLRALVAASYRVDAPAREVQALIDLLAAPPVYELPRATHAHLRHYMPVPGSTTLVIDAFAASEGGAAEPASIVVAWPDAQISSPQRALLARLCDHVSYLGRAESWTAASVLDDWRGTANAVPADSESARYGVVGSFVQLPALESADRYSAWREGFLDAQSGKKKRVPPADLWDALHADTSALQKDGWSRAPGMRLVRYALLETEGDAPGASSPRRAENVNVARFRLSSPVLPSLRDAVSVGERMRQAAMSHSDRLHQRQLAVFSGRNEHGHPAEGHMHAYWLPEDRDADGKIDHIVAFAPSGFDADARDVLAQVRRVWGNSGHDLELVLIESGERSVFGTTLSTATQTHSPLLGEAREWISRTPFIPPRHIKRGDSPEEQLLRLLERVGLPSPLRLEAYPAAFHDEPHTRHKPIAWLEFRRERRHGSGARGSNQGFGFRLVFEAPVRGPIALGYGAHFGLGQFVALS